MGVGKVIRDGPLEVTGGGETVPPKKLPARETCLKDILQAVIPKNSPRKRFLQTSGLFKKILAPKLFHHPPPPRPLPLFLMVRP